MNYKQLNLVKSPFIKAQNKLKWGNFSNVSKIIKNLKISNNFQTQKISTSWKNIGVYGRSPVPIVE